MTTYQVVVELEELPERGGKAFNVNGRSILICRSAGHVYALENQCTHAAAPLEGGMVRGVHIFCPLHGARFDMRDGSTAGALTKTAVKTYGVRVLDGRVEVALDEA
jgi:3-phenylpropionate/trans-cinnamate dioxygenase ferredoxin component